MSKMTKVSKTLFNILKIFKMHVILCSMCKIASLFSQELPRLTMNSLTVTGVYFARYFC
jgi:hypothetical protein